MGLLTNFGGPSIIPAASQPTQPAAPGVISPPVGYQTPNTLALSGGVLNGPVVPSSPSSQLLNSLGAVPLGSIPQKASATPSFGLGWLLIVALALLLFFVRG